MTGIRNRLDIVLALTEQVRSRYGEIELVSPKYKALILAVAYPKGDGEQILTQAAEAEELRRFLLESFAEVETMHDALLRQASGSPVKSLPLFPPNLFQEAASLPEAVKGVFESLARQREILKGALLPLKISDANSRLDPDYVSEGSVDET